MVIRVRTHPVTCRVFHEKVDTKVNPERGDTWTRAGWGGWGKQTLGSSG